MQYSDSSTNDDARVAILTPDHGAVAVEEELPNRAMEILGAASRRELTGAACARWWVVHTRSRNEKLVALALARQGVGHYLPLVHLRRTYATRQGQVSLPLFPSYLFLWGEADAREKAWQTKRVANILQVEDQERLTAELRQVQRALQSGEGVELYPSLRVGRRCRISGGSLKGLEGVVIRRGRRCRMYLAVKMLGQSAVIEIEAALLEVAEGRDSGGEVAVRRGSERSKLCVPARDRRGKS